VVGPAAQRDVIRYAVEKYQVSERRACRAINASRSTIRYNCRPDQNEWLRTKLKTLASQRRRFGSPRLTVLVKREGYKVNHKRIERIYQEENLQIKKRKKHRETAPLRVAIPTPSCPNERWSMDFVSDSLSNGRKFRCLTIVDDFTRESPAIFVDTSLPGQRVTRVLDYLSETRGGLPDIITCDNGPEFAGIALVANKGLIHHKK
jgi:putative transposase